MRVCMCKRIGFHEVFFDFSPLNKKYFQLKFQPANYDGDSDNIRNNDAEDVEQEDSITQTMA